MTVQESEAAGIAFVHQELNLFNDLTVAENLFLTREPVNRWGRIDKKRIHREAAALFDSMGVEMDPAEMVGRLKTSQKQLLEIAKALWGKAKLIILDEPTTALNTREVDHLFCDPAPPERTERHLVSLHLPQDAGGLRLCRPVHRAQQRPLHRRGGHRRHHAGK